MKTVNIEIDYPTVEEAIDKFEDHLRVWKKEVLFKVIHGYGSTGVGGKIKRRLHLLLEEKKSTGGIIDYLPGEAYTSFMGKGDLIQTYRQWLKEDRDYNKENDGITYVILRRI